MVNTTHRWLMNNAIFIVLGVFALICIIISIFSISHRVHVAQIALDAAYASQHVAAAP